MRNVRNETYCKNVSFHAFFVSIKWVPLDFLPRPEDMLTSKLNNKSMCIELDCALGIKE